VPEGHIEAALATSWRDLLRVDRVGRSDNFFQLGGHSLLAMRLVSHIRSQLNVSIRVRDVFELPTLCELASLITTTIGLAKGSLTSANAPVEREITEMSDSEILAEIERLKNDMHKPR
jgi:acyl carrier protein